MENKKSILMMAGDKDLIQFSFLCKMGDGVWKAKEQLSLLYSVSLLRT